MTLSFIIAFLLSFFGSVPPGAINLSVLQLSIDHKYKAAVRFSLAAAVVEFPYAFIAVKFQEYLLSQPLILDNLKLLAAGVMLALGGVNLYTALISNGIKVHRLQDSGFRKGLIISILNPLAIPFWIGVTAYLSSIGWVELNTNTDMLIYVSGISAGTFCLLALLAILGKKVSFLFKKDDFLRIIPGAVFILLGVYALIRYFNLV